MEDRIYIAGASSRAQTVKVYIEYLFPKTIVQAYLVSPEMNDNPSEVDEVPVLNIDVGLDTSLPVYIGTRGGNFSKLTAELKAAGFHDIRPVTVQLDTELRNAYMKKVFRAEGKVFRKLDDYKAINEKTVSCDAAIYAANSIHDGIVKTAYRYLKEEKLLQVGALLTDERIKGCTAYDCTGDNISEKNQNFCELTGLYWIWKNSMEDYVGLVHYRRHFLLPENWVDIMAENRIDVVLPVPLYVSPSISENYRIRHVASDWEYLMGYFRTNLPDEYESALHFFEGNIYNPCNMLIARREVLDDLCSWMFPIIFAVAEHIGEKEDSYQRRYPGFMSERLITYFFESRKEKYKVVYCDKNFLC